MAAGIDQERRIILMGKVGAGKSATGNAILGKEAFISDQSFDSITKKCSYATEVKNGKSYIVYDSPGAQGLAEDKKKFYEHLKRCLYVTSPGFHCIVFVIAADQRLQQSDLDMFKEFRGLLGERAFLYTMIIFTKIEPAKLDKLISPSKEMASLCKSCGDRYLSFGKNSDVNELQDLVKKFELMLEDLILKNEIAYYTHPLYDKAYEIIYKDAADIRRKKAFISYNAAFEEARKAAFQGKSPRDKDLLSLRNFFSCCIIL